METVWRPTHQVELHRTIGQLGHGRRDPTFRVEPDRSIWRTTNAPTGPATVRLVQRGGHEVHAEAWGPGADWVIAGVPDLLGAGDDLEGFVPGHPLVDRTHRSHPWLRLSRSNLVFESLVPAILEQKVTGLEANRAFARLTARYGTTPPGPAPLGMVIPPPPEVWQRIPSWEWHKAGVQPPQSKTVIAAARLAARLEEAVTLPADQALARLRAVPGVGEWTAAEVAQRAWGSPDAISVGDFHLAAFVGWALLGKPIDDAAMVELLEPWRGHRQRVVRLLELSGAHKPKFAPRLTIADHRAI
ncbi:MAG: 3-methyladenine glycosylase [Frankiales bacterium]|nr:3-methyladenine glycosylase [Frankiales bacterium]